MKTINDFILFESDQEFVDFCLAPYGVVVYPENGTPPYYTGVYSENYKNAIIEGKTFIIKDKKHRDHLLDFHTNPSGPHLHAVVVAVAIDRCDKWILQ